MSRLEAGGYDDRICALVRVVRLIDARLLPRGWFDLLRQLALFSAAYFAYQFVRGAVDGSPGRAFWNATKIIRLEHGLHVFVEPTVQAWASTKPWLIDFADWMYLNSHFTVTISALAFLYLFRNSSFYFVRNMFMFAMGIALVGYFVFPTAPPRLMPEWNFTDSVADFTGVQVDNASVSALLNLYAAVPSMHVCFALMVGGSLSQLVRPRPLKVLWALYPLLVTFVVVATGNHFLTDAFLGATTAGLAALGARQLARMRPRAWSFREPVTPVLASAPAEAPATAIA
jgi:hypothetical protein